MIEAVVEKISRAVRDRSLVVPVMMAFLFWNAASLSGKTFAVNSTTATVDSTPGDGVCAATGGACTLRAAIQEANALAGRDTIIVPAGTYTLTIPGRGETAAAAGDLDITDSLTINGAGSATTIIQSCAPSPDTCGGIDRVFHVDPNAAGIRATISGVTIRNGTTEIV